jgi:N-acetyl-gamma-glutamylphosphate reductase
VVRAIFLAQEFRVVKSNNSAHAHKLYSSLYFQNPYINVIANSSVCDCSMLCEKQIYEREIQKLVFMFS